MGHVAREDALAFGWALSVAAVATMGLFVNFLAAALLAFTVFFYVVVYTLWLKRRTPQNIVIGGLAGALPPAIGWAAVTGDRCRWRRWCWWRSSSCGRRRISGRCRCGARDDYARAGVPMLPVVKGKPHTRCQILLYTLVLVPLGVLPAFIGIRRRALSGGVGRHRPVVPVGSHRHLARDATKCKEPAAQRLFGVSLLYLFALFAALIVEQLAGIPPLALDGEVVRDDDADTRDAANAISRWRWRSAALSILFYLMSIVQWHEHAGH